jgi:hypothetical protein
LELVEVFRQSQKGVDSLKHIPGGSWHYLEMIRQFQGGLYMAEIDQEVS